MFRLYLRIYVALLGSIALFGLMVAVVWHLAGGPLEQAGVTVSRLVQNVLPPAQSPIAEQQEALRRLAAGLKGDVTLFASDGTVSASIGQRLAPPRADPMRALMWRHWHGGTVSSVRLADGRVLVASVPIGYANSRSMFHTMLLLLASAIGVAAFPVARYLTGRLERLQQGVDAFGAGDLKARVAVEGGDEVARLAQSFNRTAAHIEQLVTAHQALLANASHELRTPLARIRLAVEILKNGADAGIETNLTRDIGELNDLVEEILLASRLDAVPQNEVQEEVDLLALCAEECARYDSVQLDGVPISVRGDPRLLRRLVRNLLENAELHGTPPAQIRLTRDGDRAVMTVWDQGPGPAPAEFDHVFTPFHRRANARSGTGHGLGLSLVRQIARRHGGDARCMRLPNGGGGFVITLAVTA